MNKSGSKPKNLNLLLKGKRPRGVKNNQIIVKTFLNEPQIEVESDGIELKRVVNFHEDSERQLLLLKVKTVLVRKELIQKALNLRNTANYGELYIMLGLKPTEQA